MDGLDKAKALENERRERRERIATAVLIGLASYAGPLHEKIYDAVALADALIDRLDDAPVRKSCGCVRFPQSYPGGSFIAAITNYCSEHVPPPKLVEAEDE